MKILVKSVTIVACLAMSGFALAVSNPTEPTQVNPTNLATAAQNNTQIFHGIVKRLDDGMALYTAKEVYPLIGGNFDMIAGKNVNITGKLVEIGNSKQLTVKRIQLND